MSEALERLIDIHDLSIGYSLNHLDKDRIIILEGRYTVQKVLEHLFVNSRLKYEFKGKRILISKKILYNLTGRIQDSVSGEALPYATIHIDELNEATETNEFGYYHLLVPEGQHNVTFRYLGRKTATFALNMDQDVRLDGQLISDVTLSEIEVVQNRDAGSTIQNDLLDQSEFIRLNEIIRGPGGQSDVLHTLRSLPGVASGGGGIGGLYVRGGNSSHNLVILDGVTVYNSHHMMGLLSIFDANAVRGIQFYSSGISAKYGGRLSSVIDIQTKEGQSDVWSGIFDASPQNIGGYLSGPLLGNLGTFSISGRRSLFAPFAKRDIQNGFYFGDEDTENLNFYDINAKVSIRLTDSDRLYASYYNGRDLMNGYIEEENSTFDDFLYERQMVYGNNTWAIRWNRIWSSQLFNNTTINYSNFYNESEMLLGEISEDSNDLDFYDYGILRSDNSEWAIKSDFELNHQGHLFKFGINFKGYEFTPAAESYDSFSDFDDISFDEDSIRLDNISSTIDVQNLSAQEIHIYVEDEFNLSKKLQTRIGLRMNFFMSDKDYIHVEPRLSFLYHYSAKTKLSASLTHSHQYIHRLFTKDLGLPQDYWFPSGINSDPEYLWQYDLAWRQKLSNSIDIKTSIYHKQFGNLVNLSSSSLDIISSETIADFLISGTGASTGLELSMSYSSEKIFTHLAYTLSKTTRTFKDENQGQSYPYVLDARHNLHMNVAYNLNKRWSFGLNAHLSSPRPRVDVFQSEQSFGVLTFDDPSLSTKHRLRGSVHHRLDLSVAYEIQRAKWAHIFKFGIYNIFDHSNPVFNVENSDNSNPISFSVGRTPFIKYQIKFN